MQFSLWLVGTLASKVKNLQKSCSDLQHNVMILELNQNQKKGK